MSAIDNDSILLIFQECMSDKIYNCLYLLHVDSTKMEVRLLDKQYVEDDYNKFHFDISNPHRFFLSRDDKFLILRYGTVFPVLRMENSKLVLEEPFRGNLTDILTESVRFEGKI